MKSILVVGSGIAGMTAALEAVEHYDVTLLTKSGLSQSNTRYAQGGVAVVTTEDDSVESHVVDTMLAGAGISDHDTVQVLCAEGPGAIDELIDRGVRFDEVGGHLAHGLEAAHSYARILHAGGDATGAGIAYALIDQVLASKVCVRESMTAVDLVIEDLPDGGRRAVGVVLLDGEVIRADVVILATGGAGQLFPHTTNPEIATGDGVAMALRAGVVVSDLEFYQFHPTSLDAPGNFLISEAVRGEGAVLINREGKRFMLGIHPDAELAPRDVVARAIAVQMAQQSGVPVRLDCTHLGAESLGAEFLAKRFPNIDAACRVQGFDWANEPIPVTPAAHYWMGGIRTDEWGRTSIPGLYAVGEVACNGLHGANRLASNSLLEGAVYATRCIGALADPPPADGWDVEWAPPVVLDLADHADADNFTCDDLQTLMWESAGLTRTGDRMRAASRRLAAFSTPKVTDAKSAEDANLLIVARAVVAMALAREESRGGHYRSDFPETLPAQAHHCSAVQK